MVLPPSAPHDAPRPAEAAWLDSLKLALGLSRSGLLLLVDHARPALLGELVRALLPEHPGLEVHTELQRMLDVPSGSTLVLVPRPEDADWLNINRPVFAQRELRVVLFCETETTVALAQKAVDFFDWISHRVECPNRPPRFAVAGIRCALAARAPGIVWKGGDLEAAFAEARPRGKLHEISAARPYPELVGEVRKHRGAWIAWNDVDGQFRLRRAQWALAELGHRTRAILSKPAVQPPGWWPAHARVVDLRVARSQLVDAKAQFPGRLAALTDLEPETLDLLRTLLEHGESEPVLEAVLMRTKDPGAALAGFAGERDVVPLLTSVHSEAPPPSARARMAQSHANLVRPHSARAQRGRVFDLTDAFRVYKPWIALGELALDEGDIEGATYWAQRAVDAGLSTASALLAKVRHHQGHYEEAELVSRNSLESAVRRLGTSPSRGSQLQDRALVLGKQGKYVEAEQLLRQALAIEQRALGMEHPSYGKVLHDLAWVLGQQGKYVEAEPLLQQALAINEKALGVEHPSYGKVLHDLAWVLRQQGKYAEAEQLLREVLAFEQTVLGLEQSSSGKVLHDLAWVLGQQGQYVEAEVLLRKALALNKKALGEKHPSYHEVLYSLAWVLRQQGKYAEAEQFLREVLAVQQTALGLEQPSSGKVLHDLAWVLGQQGQYVEAEVLLRKALALNKKVPWVEYPSHHEVLHTLSWVLRQQGRYAEAEQILRQL